MASEIRYRHDTTGKTLYGLLFNTSGQVWSVAGAAWATFSVANFANYVIALTETPAGGYRYIADMPAVGATAAWYSFEFYEQVGASAAITDTLLSVFQAWWTGVYLCPAPPA
jgi:hypothetical protein